MQRSRIGPGPTAESGARGIGKGLPQLGLGVHHEASVPATEMLAPLQK
jgi:hypothetical protein